MPKILIFYEDGMIKEMEGVWSPEPYNYPSYTILYNPFSLFVCKWFICMQYAFPNTYQWDEINPTHVNKHFRTYALISG